MFKSSYLCVSLHILVQIMSGSEVSLEARSCEAELRGTDGLPSVKSCKNEVFANIKDEVGAVTARVEVRAEARTGVEMEALCGVSAALLNIWDMVKSIEKDDTGNYPDTLISDIHVVEKFKDE